jgi:DNA ligase (NAD+)
MTPAEAQREVSQLRRDIARHDDLYHRQSAPEIGDAEYDRLKQRLASLEQLFPEAAKHAQPLAAFGDDRSGLFQTARHRVPMLSLDKAYGISEVRAFHTRLAKKLGRSDVEYVIEPKYDGLAISVTYEKGRLIRAVTRGNGVEGDDVTANVRQIPGVLPDLRTMAGHSLPEVIELRGEIYVPLAEFERVNADRERMGEPRFANPRNLAAGTVRQMDGREVARRGLQIVFFGIGECEPATVRPRSQRELHAAIRTWGLPAMEKFWSGKGADDLLRAIDTVGSARTWNPI